MLSGNVPGTHESVHLRPGELDGDALARVDRRTRYYRTPRARRTHADAGIDVGIRGVVVEFRAARVGGRL
eukprot:371269-Pleurochrysis_carterae.AAC.1